MSDEEDALLAWCAFLFIKIKVSRRSRRKRRWWQRRIYANRGRQFLPELRMEDHILFNNFSRMDTTTFERLIVMIGPKIAKRHTNYREPICVKTRLLVTLRFLATGDSYVSLMYLFRISKQLIGTIVPEVCEALIEALTDHLQVKKIIIFSYYLFK